MQNISMLIVYKKILDLELSDKNNLTVKIINVVLSMFFTIEPPRFSENLFSLLCKYYPYRTVQHLFDSKNIDLFLKKELFAQNFLYYFFNKEVHGGKKLKLFIALTMPRKLGISIWKAKGLKVL